MTGLKGTKYRPARLDWPESSIIAKAFLRSSTTTCFKFLILIQNFYPSAKFLVAKYKNASNFLILRQAASILFSGTLLFDEIRQSTVLAVYRARLGDTKKPSKYKMYSSRIF
jgi:hypothetical protein